MRYVGPALVVCLLALIILVPGCAKKQTPAGGVTRSRQETPPTVEQKEPPAAPSAETGKDESAPPVFSKILEEQIGVPIYPGAKQQSDLSTGKDSRDAAILMVSFTTPDSFDQVRAFYRKNLKGYKETNQKTPDGSMFSGFRRSSGGNSELIVIESPPKKPTRIAMTITKAGKANP
jgi:hypothetical protein